MAGQKKASRDHEGVVRVRYREGTLHGLLELRDAQGRVLAHGSLTQSFGDHGLRSRLTLRFADRSYFDETTTFTLQPGELSSD